MKTLKMVMVALVWLWLSSAAYARQVEAVDKIVAVVNEKVITASELEKRLAEVRMNLQGTETPLPPMDILRKQVLENMILQSAQVQLAKRMELTVSDQELQQAIQQVAKRNRQTVSGLKSSLVDRGLTFAEFKQALRRQILIGKLQDEEVGRKIQLDPQAVKQLTHELENKAKGNRLYHLSDILLPLPEEPTSAQVVATEQQAKQLAAQLAAGKSFSQAAVGQSSGHNALKGGDMGWHHLAGLPEVFAKQVQHMKIGSVSEPIRTGNGFHIIKLKDMKADPASGKLTATQRRRLAEKLLYQREFNQHLQAWLQQLRASAYVKLQPDAKDLERRSWAYR